MNASGFKHVYGPVPSRRLGLSLGIDPVPFKVCSYDCIYCQLGRTTDRTVERRPYVAADRIIAELEKKLAEEKRPDYIGIAGSGEPTLNSETGRILRKIRHLTNIPVAVFTNGSLLWMKEVQDDLMAADIVIPSLDAGDRHFFRKINRPHPDILFDRMVDGIAEFTKRFQGEVWLESLLLEGMNGTLSEAKKISALAEKISPSRIQLNTVFRPPAEKFARPLSTNHMDIIKKLFKGQVDIITEYKDEAGFPLSTVLAEDILSLLGRRPCTASDLSSGLGININEAVKVLEGLVAEGKADRAFIGGRDFYILAANISGRHFSENF